MLEEHPKPYSYHKGAAKRANATGSKVELIYQNKFLVPNVLAVSSPVTWDNSV